MAGKLHSMARKFKSIDQFGDEFEMQIDGELSNTTSYMGTILTIIFVILIATFAYSKIMVLVDMGDVTVVGSTADDYFTDDDHFDSENGFFVAAALTYYDSDTEPVQDLRYGELTIEWFGWGNDDISSAGMYDLQHQCTDEELGLV